jgi:hypothetical protein
VSCDWIQTRWWRRCEVRRVLRPHNPAGFAEHQKAAGLSERDAGVFLDAVISMALPVRTHYLWRPQLRDANDELVLEAAVNGQADVLVTFNLRGYGRIPAQFEIEALLPSEALGRIPW